MDRLEFLKTLAVVPLSVRTMTISALATAADALASTDPMPVIFVGHGSPMNAITDNAYSRAWRAFGARVPKPNAILSVSAHWLTHNGCSVTAMDRPKTIHDFGGFPEELFNVQYPAPGTPHFAEETRTLITPHPALDQSWGLDHGTWSVLVHMYPKADIPVYQLSIDYNKPAQYHFDLGKQLAALRRKGVLIMGSGNIVHNLRMVNFDAGAEPFGWAIEFDKTMAAHISAGDFQSVVEFQKMGSIATLAHPTYDHFLPLLYVLGAKEKNDALEYFNTGIDAGSISMRSVVLGAVRAR